MDNMKITECPCCFRHCPLDAVSCGRGEEIVQRLKNGEVIDPEQYKRKSGSGYSAFRERRRKRGQHGEHAQDGSGPAPEDAGEKQKDL